MRLTYYLSKDETTNIVIQVNENGWPLNVSQGERDLNCLNLWMLFAHEESHSQSIMDITTDLEIKKQNGVCKYYHLDDEELALIFNYDVNSGNVDTI